MPWRVALDIGAADPSAARVVVQRALDVDPDLHLVVVGPRPDDAPDDARASWRDATPPSADLDPVVAVRGRADLSVRVALELGRDAEVDAVVSATALPALLTGTRFLLRRRTGVRDPLVATTLATAGGDVVVLDTSGHAGTTAGALVEASHDLGLLPDRVGLLDAGAGDDRAAAALAGRLDRDVRPVSPAEALAGVVPLVLADGAAGGLFVATVRALAPATLGPSRLVGLTPDAPTVLPVGPDPDTWAASLATDALEVVP